MKNQICRAAIVAAVMMAANIAALQSDDAANIYPVRVSNASVTGDVDMLWFDPSQVSLTISNWPGGGRRATFSISGGGGGGTNTWSTNGLTWIAYPGLNFTNQSPSLGSFTFALTSGIPTIGLQLSPSIATTSVTNGLLTAASTNSLASTAFVNAVSNTLANAISGSGGSSNAFVPGLGIEFTDYGGTPDTNGIALDPSVVLTNGSNISRLNNDAGYVTASVTNGLGGSSITNGLVAQASLPVAPGALASTSYVNAVSNFLASTVIGTNGLLAASVTNGAATTVTALGAIFTNGLLQSASSIVPLTNNDSRIAILNGGTVATTGVTNGLLTGSSTNSLASTGYVNAVSNFIASVMITNAASTVPALVGVTINNGTLTISPSSFLLTNTETGITLDGINLGQTITNVASAGQSGNGSVALGNNTATITFPAGASVTGTNSVASVNTLVSNITITATGNATISTASSTSGGTITVNDPKQFAETNPASASPSPLFWDTKYGALRCSNNFGATFINTPDLASTSNENSTLTDYFTSTSTSAWIQVNWAAAWSVGNTNNWLWVQSSGEVNATGRYLLKAIPITNQSWRCRILIQPMLGEVGSSTINAGAGLVSAESTNSNLHIFTMWRGSGGISELRAFVPSTPSANYSGATESGVDNSTLAQWWGGSTALELGPHVPFWMQISYDGSMTQKYTYCLSQNGLPPPINQNGQYTFIKTNQTVNPTYVGIVVNDDSTTKPTFAIKAFVFEQP